MNFIKKNIKWIITIIVMMILSSGLTVYATTYLASNITYTRTGKSINNVGDALDDLYNTQSGIAQTDATAGDIRSGKKAYTTNGLIVGNLFTGNYSTSEQIVGKWTDGKNIYQKTFNDLNSTLNNNDWVTLVSDVSGLNIKAIINSYAISTIQSTFVGIPIVVQLKNNQIRGFCYGMSGCVISSMTIQYTKTTD